MVRAVALRVVLVVHRAQARHQVLVRAHRAQALRVHLVAQALLVVLQVARRLRQAHRALALRVLAHRAAAHRAQAHRAHQVVALRVVRHRRVALAPLLQVAHRAVAQALALRAAQQQLRKCVLVVAEVILQSQCHQRPLNQHVLPGWLQMPIVLLLSRSVNSEDVAAHLTTV